MGIKRLPDGDHYQRYRLRVDRPDAGVPDLLQSGSQEGLPGAQPPREVLPGPQPPRHDPPAALGDDLPF